MHVGMPRGCWPLTNGHWPRLTRSGIRHSNGSRQSTSRSEKLLRQESWPVTWSCALAEHTGAIFRRMRAGTWEDLFWPNAERTFFWITDGLSGMSQRQYTECRRWVELGRRPWRFTLVLLTRCSATDVSASLCASSPVWKSENSSHRECLIVESPYGDGHAEGASRGAVDSNLRLGSARQPSVLPALEPTADGTRF
jgi:hypothetical protein